LNISKHMQKTEDPNLTCDKNTEAQYSDFDNIQQQAAAEESHFINNQQLSVDAIQLLWLVCCRFSFYWCNYNTWGIL